MERKLLIEGCDFLDPELVRKLRQIPDPPFADRAKERRSFTHRIGAARMDILSAASWIVLGLVALYGVPYGGVRWMMHCQGWTLVGAAGIVAVSPISKFFVVLALPVSFFLPMFLMTMRVNRGMAQFQASMRQKEAATVQPS